MWYVYILQSLKNRHYYIGSTDNLRRRLQEHNKGKSLSTRNKGPYVIVYTETLLNLLGARRRELQIKSYKGGNAFKKLLKLN